MTQSNRQIRDAAGPVAERRRAEAVAKTMAAALMVVLFLAAVALTVAGFR